MLRQVLKAVILTAVLLTFTSSAWAGGLGVIFDPVLVPDSFTGYYDITQVGVPYTGAVWSSCAFAQSRYVGQPTDPFADATGCMYFVNDTGVPITDLNISFDYTGLTTQSFGCTFPDNTLSGNPCPTSISTGTIPLEFDGGNPIPPSTPLNLELFIVGLTGADPSAFVPDSLQVPTHDPSTLLLLASGIGLLGLCSFRRAACL